MAEVGKLEPIKIDGNYSGGQLFLHRLFGYRGVILFPWSARVYDRDKSAKTAEPSNTTTPQGYQPPTQAPPGTVCCKFTKKIKNIIVALQFHKILFCEKPMLFLF